MNEHGLGGFAQGFADLVAVRKNEAIGSGGGPVRAAAHAPPEFGDSKAARVYFGPLLVAVAVVVGLLRRIVQVSGEFAFPVSHRECSEFGSKDVFDVSLNVPEGNPTGINGLVCICQ
ncbi:MAG: hypothetical protein ACYDC1_00355 [Limisphaerales bacterium]